MSNAVKTIHHTNLELRRSMGVPFAVDPFSTLNEVFGMANQTPPETGYPEIRYIGIGRGGHRNVTGTGGSSLVDILKHGVTDAALFEQLPFVMRLTTNDLTVEERSRYRIRRLETFNGVEYFCYYLRVINEMAVVPTARVVQLVDGKVTSDVAYDPVPASLAPSPINLSNTIVNAIEGRHIVVESEVTILLDTNDITEFLNAVEIRYGDVRYATISEVAIVSAFDKEVTSSEGGASITYTEVQAAQVVNFIGTEVPLQHNPPEVSFSFGLSNSLPLPPVL